MSRPYKDPVEKAEKTVNQILGKFRILRRMAESGHLNAKQYDKIEVAVTEESAKLMRAIKNYKEPVAKKPFKL